MVDAFLLKGRTSKPELRHNLYEKGPPGTGYTLCGLLVVNSTVSVSSRTLALLIILASPISEEHFSILAGYKFRTVGNVSSTQRQLTLKAIKRL